MSQFFNQTLNLNVTHQSDAVSPATDPTNLSTNLSTSVPDTGFSTGAIDGAINGLTSTTIIFFTVVAFLIAVGSILFYLRRKAKKQKQADFYRIASIACFAVAFGFVIPSVASLSYATDTTSTITTEFDAVATTDGNISTTDVTLTLDTDYTYGYTITAYMTDGATTQTNTLYGTDDPSAQIVATQSAATTEDLTMNSYGIKAQSATDPETYTYTSISADPANPTTLFTTDQSATTGSTAQITYVTNLDKTTAEDTYTGKITFEIEANPAPTTSFDEAFEDAGKQKDATTGLYKMQDMNSSICAAITTASATETSSTQAVQLVDTRDNHTYWVAKLPDGKCWMTQNLDLVLSKTTTLTPADSDVSSNWTPSNNTQTTQYKEVGGTTHSEAIWENDYNTAAHSYRPASDAAAGTSGKYGRDSYTYYSPVIMTNGTTMSSYKTEAECVAGGYTAEQCAHWNVGTFYSWYTATAGTGNASVASETNATDSICPAGWHLPSSTGSGEIQALVTAANITKSNITSAPYYFLRPGYYSSIDAIEYNGSTGAYWSSTSYPDTANAYSLLLDATNVYPSFNLYRDYGFNIRCIANS